MIKKLSVKNFKSIKDLEIDCKKVNLFIGEPNTGKSNILEALGLLSWCGYKNTDLKGYVRFESIYNLFYDDLIDQSVRIEIKDETKDINLEIEFVENKFCLKTTTLGPGDIHTADGIIELDYLGNILGISGDFSRLSSIKFYRFLKQERFLESRLFFLIPPYGSNMFSVVWGSKNLRRTMAGFFKDFGLRFVFKPQEQTFEIQKQIEDMAVAYPYVSTSDTLQRIIFHVMAMESNRDSTLIFEEPESHAFPYYTKYLGERIGFDQTNQYFISTHNPYLLLSILEKTPKDSINVFITYFKDYQTKVKCLTNEEISELMDYDPFANLDLFIEKEG